MGLDALPDFHRAFLAWRGVANAAELPLRRVQQRVESELNRLVQAGEGTRTDQDWLLQENALTGFDAARPYL